MLVSFRVPDKFNFKGFKENYGDEAAKKPEVYNFIALMLHQ